MTTAPDTVRQYHEATKHHPHRYARSLGWLDWANQPDPFRRFAGAPVRLLPPADVAGAGRQAVDRLRGGA